jgi:hypothetical protein
MRGVGSQPGAGEVGEGVGSAMGGGGVPAGVSHGKPQASSCALVRGGRVGQFALEVTKMPLLTLIKIGDLLYQVNG